MNQRMDGVPQRTPYVDPHFRPPVDEIAFFRIVDADVSELEFRINKHAAKLKFYEWSEQRQTREGKPYTKYGNLLLFGNIDDRIPVSTTDPHTIPTDNFVKSSLKERIKTVFWVYVYCVLCPEPYEGMPKNQEPRSWNGKTYYIKPVKEFKMWITGPGWDYEIYTPLDNIAQDWGGNLNQGVIALQKYEGPNPIREGETTVRTYITATDKKYAIPQGIDKLASVWDWCVQNHSKAYTFTPNNQQVERQSNTDIENMVS